MLKTSGLQSLVTNLTLASMTCDLTSYCRFLPTKQLTPPDIINLGTFCFTLNKGRGRQKLFALWKIIRQFNYQA